MSLNLQLVLLQCRLVTRRQLAQPGFCFGVVAGGQLDQLPVKVLGQLAAHERILAELHVVKHIWRERKRRPQFPCPLRRRIETIQTVGVDVNIIGPGQQALPVRVVGLRRVRQGRLNNDEPGPERGRVPTFKDFFFKPFDIDLEPVHLTLAKLPGNAGQRNGGHLQLSLRRRHARLNVAGCDTRHSRAEPGVRKHH